MKIFFREFIVGFFTFDFKRCLGGFLFMLLELFTRKEEIDIDE